MSCVHSLENETLNGYCTQPTTGSHVSAASAAETEVTLAATNRYEGH